MEYWGMHVTKTLEYGTSHLLAYTLDTANSQIIGWSLRPCGGLILPLLESIRVMLGCLCSCSVAKECLTLWPHGLQHARLPCLSLSPGVCSNSCPLNAVHITYLAQKSTSISLSLSTTEISALSFQLSVCPSLLDALVSPWTHMQLSVQPTIWKEFKQIFCGSPCWKSFAGFLSLISSWFYSPKLCLFKTALPMLFKLRGTLRKKQPRGKSYFVRFYSFKGKMSFSFCLFFGIQPYHNIIFIKYLSRIYRIIYNFNYINHIIS